MEVTAHFWALLILPQINNQQSQVKALEEEIAGMETQIQGLNETLTEITMEKNAQEITIDALQQEILENQWLRDEYEIIYSDLQTYKELYEELLREIAGSE